MICGVDVSSERLDAQLGRQGVSKSFSNDQAGIAALADFCRQHKVQRMSRALSLSRTSSQLSPDRVAGNQPGDLLFQLFDLLGEQ